RRQQVEILEDDADFVASQRGPAAARLDRCALPQHAAAAGRVEPGGDVEQGRLAAAALADQRDRLAGGDRQVNAVERRDAAALEGSMHALECDERSGPGHGCYFFPARSAVAAGTLPRGPRAASKLARGPATRPRPSTVRSTACQPSGPPGCKVQTSTVPGFSAVPYCTVTRWWPSRSRTRRTVPSPSSSRTSTSRQARSRRAPTAAAK